MTKYLLNLLNTDFKLSLQDSLKEDIILSAVKKRIRKMSHKYGIEIPKGVEDAHQIDRKNGNT